MADTAYLSIDLGTTQTVAVARRDGQPQRSLLFDGSPLLASGVFADRDGTLHTGRDAERLAQVEPGRFEPQPKRRVDEGMVLLGDYEYPVTVLLSAVLQRVRSAAVEAGLPMPAPTGGSGQRAGSAHGSGPGTGLYRTDSFQTGSVDTGALSGSTTVVLTCPADWGRSRRAVLQEAAARAGLGPVTLVDEPIAAATYCVDVLGQQVSDGQALAVFDFGGGTLDVAVVRREPGGLRVLATGGLDDLGGLDVDNALVGHLGQVLAARDPRAWQRLSQPVDAVAQRDRRALWTEVRSAKEMLSRTSAAPVQVPGVGEALHLTREELERVAGPLIDRGVDEARRVLERSGIDRRQLAGVFLVGGSSRIPLVASRLHARLGVAPGVPEQPELPVAAGGLIVADWSAAQSRAGGGGGAVVAGMSERPGSDWRDRGANQLGVPTADPTIDGRPIQGGAGGGRPGVGRPDLGPDFGRPGGGAGRPAGAGHPGIGPGAGRPGDDWPTPGGGATNPFDLDQSRSGRRADRPGRRGWLVGAALALVALAVIGVVGAPRLLELVNGTGAAPGGQQPGAEVTGLPTPATPGPQRPATPPPNATPPTRSTPDPNDPPTGFAACGDGIYCPKVEICWGGLVVTAGTTVNAREQSCRDKHTNETFVVAWLPDDAVDLGYEDLLDHPVVKRSCTPTQMKQRTKPGYSTDKWSIDIITKTARGNRKFVHCLAGPGILDDKQTAVFKIG